MFLKHLSKCKQCKCMKYCSQIMMMSKISFCSCSFSTDHQGVNPFLFVFYKNSCEVYVKKSTS